MHTSANAIYPESDPRHHTTKVKKLLDELIAGLRDDTEHFTQPGARALFASSADVLEDLRTAFDDYETHPEAPGERYRAT